jgi:pyruvate formate lyase activating enzyme
VLRLLESRKEMVDGVVISGGEPTIQKGLAGIMERIRSIGCRIKLDTNGSRPEVLDRIIMDGLADYIAMDIKAPPEKYHLLAGRKVQAGSILESIRMIAGSGIRHEFRTTRVTPLLSNADILEIKMLLPESSPHILQRFKPENSLDPELRREPAAGAGMERTGPELR